MKYLIFTNGNYVVFPECQSHKEMANGRPVLHAGFCRVETYRNQFDDIRAKVYVYGKSDSLNVESSQQDADILKNMFL